MGTRWLRATFVLLDAFLSSMSHHQVLCLHACCLSVCFVCTLSKAYFSSDPLETCSRGSLVKNGLRIGNKTIVMFIACVVFPDVLPKSD